MLCFKKGSVNAGCGVLAKKNKLNLKVDNLIYLFLVLFVLVAFFIFEIFFTGFFVFDTFVVFVTFVAFVAFFIFEIFFTGLLVFDTFVALVAFFIFEIFFTGFFATTFFGFAFVLASLGFAIVANNFCLSSHHEDFFDVAGFIILLFAINIPHTHYDNMIYIYIFVKMVL